MDLADDVARRVKQQGARLVPDSGETGHYLAVTSQAPFGYAFKQGPDKEIMVGNGDPNGVHNALKGSLYVERDAPALWQNTDGASAWQLPPSGGSGFPITYDDGTYTEQITATSGGSGGLKIESIIDAGSVLAERLWFFLGGGVEFDDFLGGGTFFEDFLGGGTFFDDVDGGGVYFNLDNAGGFFVNDNDGGAIFFNTVSGGGFYINASGPGSGGFAVDHGFISGEPEIILGEVSQVIFRGLNATLADPTDLANGDFAFWFNSGSGELHVVGRDGGGTLLTATVPLT